MTIQLSIGDFSRMTYLSVKTLRHYHAVGLLEPVEIDNWTGYRYYSAEQVPIGQVIRRFRDLGMPLDQVKEVLRAPDTNSRNEVIVAHLRHMESQLDQTQQTVASLRALLEQPRTPIAVDYRSVADVRAIAISEPVRMDDVESWWSEAFDELHRVLAPTTGARSGPDGALYPKEFFEDELGEVVAFTPIAGVVRPSGRVHAVEIPAAELATTVHLGAFSELDQTYGALGTFVTEREIGLDGAIRENYIVSYAETDDESMHRTEVCWPVFHTKGDEQ
ncbi:MAG: MerR family transcriptional regulator [Acidimicrobiales bacterium]|nr:MerR family transcriptional regulator [Acidimicrobiales bacterium]